MKASEGTITQALDIVCHPTTWPGPLSSGPTVGERVEALHRLRVMHGFRAAPPLLRRLLDLRWYDRPGVDDFAAVIEATLLTVRPEDTAWLNRQVRFWSWRHPGATFDALTPASLARWAQRLRPHVRVLGLMACHRNGFVREAMLDALDARVRSDAAAIEPALPFLAVRVNDTVPQVAAKATTLMRALLVPAHRDVIYTALPHLVRMLSGRRRAQHDLGDRLRAIIVDDDAHTVLGRFIFVGDESQSLVLETLAAFPERLRTVVRAVLRHHSGTALGLEALRRIVQIERDPSAELCETLAMLAVSSYSDAIRQEAMTHLAARAPEAAREQVTTWLFDRSAMSRLVARDLGRTLNAAHGATFDASAIYRAAIASPDGAARRLAIAVSGLAEAMTEPADLDRLAALATHASPRVRIALLRTLARVAPARATPLATAWVTADEVLVRAAAFRVLRTQVDRVDLDALRARLAPADPALRVAAIGLLHAAPKWEALIFLLEALADPDEAVRREALRRIALWLGTSNHSQRRATRAQLGRIDGLLEAYSVLLSSETLRELQFAVRSAAAVLT